MQQCGKNCETIDDEQIFVQRKTLIVTSSESDVGGATVIAYEGLVEGDLAMSAVQVSESVKRKKRTVGAVAIGLVVLFFLLLFFRIFGIIDFLIAALLVGLVANYIFRRLDRQGSH